MILPATGDEQSVAEDLTGKLKLYQFPATQANSFGRGELPSTHSIGKYFLSSYSVT